MIGAGDVRCGTGDRGRVCRQGEGEDTGIGSGGIGGGGRQGAGAPMIPVPSGVRVWLAVEHTDRRTDAESLALGAWKAETVEGSGVLMRGP